MRVTLLVLFLAVGSIPSHAISRYDIVSMRCSEVQSVVARDGAAILRYPSAKGSGMTLYDRFVADSNYCDPGDYAKPAFVPTRDNASCVVHNCQPVGDDAQVLQD